MKETAIEWLLEELNNGSHLTDKLIEQAKEMEKQQIMDANKAGVNQGLYGYKNAEEYYKKHLKTNNMTDEQIERIAELVFQKLVKKQEEWDKEFMMEMKEQVVMDISIKGTTDIQTRINNLQAHLDRLIKKELYTEAQAVKDRIDELKKELE